MEIARLGEDTWLAGDMIALVLHLRRLGIALLKPAAWLSLPHSDTSDRLRHREPLWLYRKRYNL